MPRYEYECECCKHGSEKFQPVAFRNHVWFCPACRVGLMRRQFSTAVTIVTPEHFRHDQSRFLPPKEDPRWGDFDKEGRTRERAPRPTLTDDFKKAGLLK